MVCFLLTDIVRLFVCIVVLSDDKRTCSSC